MGQVMLGLPQEPFIVGDGAGYLIALPAQGEYCNWFSHPNNLGTPGIPFLWHLRQHTGTGWLGD